MGNLSIEKVKKIKTLISQAKGLEKTMLEILKGTDPEFGRYVAFKEMAMMYNKLVIEANEILNCNLEIINTEKTKSWGNTVWPEQKRIFDTVLSCTRNLIAVLESNIDFIDEQIENVANFIKAKLRKAIHSEPTKEKDIQDSIENLFIGKGYEKGVDYDREAGKFNYSGKEYIPDFILPKLGMCIEVKLLKEASKKSKMIEEINADITAYSKKYKNILFIVYDMGNIRDETEFCRDIENNEGVRVVIVKH